MQLHKILPYAIIMKNIICKYYLISCLPSTPLQRAEMKTKIKNAMRFIQV